MSFGAINFGEVANQVCLLCEEGEDRADAESDDSEINEQFGEVKDMNGYGFGFAACAVPLIDASWSWALHFSLQFLRRITCALPVL